MKRKASKPRKGTTDAPTAGPPGPPDLGPKSGDFLVGDHVSSMGRILMYHPVGRNPIGLLSPDPETVGLDVFPGMIVRVTFQVVGVVVTELPTRNPFLPPVLAAEDAAYVRKCAADAEAVRAALAAATP